MDEEDYAQSQAPDTGGMLAVNYWLGFLGAVYKADDRCIPLHYHYQTQDD